MPSLSDQKYLPDSEVVLPLSREECCSEERRGRRQHRATQFLSMSKTCVYGINNEAGTAIVAGYLGEGPRGN